jgi:hypothetical protein
MRSLAVSCIIIGSCNIATLLGRRGATGAWCSLFGLEHDTALGLVVSAEHLSRSNWTRKGLHGVWRGSVNEAPVVIGLIMNTLGDNAHERWLPCLTVPLDY